MPGRLRAYANAPKLPKVLLMNVELSGKLPVVCKPSLHWMIISVLFSLLAIIGGVSGLIHWGVLERDPSPAGHQGLAILMVTSAGCILFGTYFTLSAMKSRVLLETDAITLLGIFSNRRLRRDAIVARLDRSINGVPNVTLYPLKKNERKLDISYWYDKNAEIRRWVSSIPVVDRAILKSRT
jgi:hypothetical protein